MRMKDMKNKKVIPIIIVGLLISISFFSGCIRPFVIDTLKWDHINEEGTAVRLWGQLDIIIESPDNWNEGFVWDIEFHKTIMGLDCFRLISKI